MGYFRLFLAGCLLAIAAYTGTTIARYGWDLLPVFFGDMTAMTWPSQFNFDFFAFLLLSGLWTAWRNSFSLAECLLPCLPCSGAWYSSRPISSS